MLSSNLTSKRKFKSKFINRLLELGLAVEVPLGYKNIFEFEIISNEFNYYIKYIEHSIITRLLIYVRKNQNPISLDNLLENSDAISKVALFYLDELNEVGWFE